MESDFNLSIGNQETELAMRMNCAAYDGHLDVLKGLIESGVDPNKTDYDGRSPLVWTLNIQAIVRINGQTQKGWIEFLNFRK